MTDLVSFTETGQELRTLCGRSPELARRVRGSIIAGLCRSITDMVIVWESSNAQRFPSFALLTRLDHNGKFLSFAKCSRDFHVIFEMIRTNQACAFSDPSDNVELDRVGLEGYVFGEEVSVECDRCSSRYNTEIVRIDADGDYWFQCLNEDEDSGESCENEWYLTPNSLASELGSTVIPILWQRCPLCNIEQRIAYTARWCHTHDKPVYECTSCNTQFEVDA